MITPDLTRRDCGEKSMEKTVNNNIVLPPNTATFGRFG